MTPFVPPFPLYIILRFLLQNPYAFEYVSDIINPPFLHSELFRSLVQVDDPVRALLQQIRKLFRKQPERSVKPRMFPNRSGSSRPLGVRRLELALERHDIVLGVKIELALDGGRGKVDGGRYHLVLGGGTVAVVEQVRAGRQLRLGGMMLKFGRRAR